MAGNPLRNCNCFQPCLALYCIVEAAQKFATGLWIILPGVLSIENYGYDSITPLREHGLGRLLNIAQQMSGRLTRVHARVNKANKIGNCMVAKYHMHGSIAVLVAMDVIQLIRQMRG